MQAILKRNRRYGKKEQNFNTRKKLMRSVHGNQKKM